MRILITAGGTREYIDSVRFISNASSGKMGYALADAAQNQGHQVTLISASDIQPPVGVEFIGVETAAEMFAAVKKFFPECDCLIMAAAVSDYTSIKKTKIKIKKKDKSLTLKLKPTPDILKWASKLKSKNYELKTSSSRPSRVLVGFALEDKDLRKNAEKKLKDKNLDMIIANEPSTIGSDDIKVQIKTPDSKWLKFPTSAKPKTAHKIIKLIEKL